MSDVLKEVLAALAKAEIDQQVDSPVVNKKNYSMSIDAISNGWILYESWEEEGEKNEDGCCLSHYQSRKTYYPTNPLEGLGSNA